MEHGCSRDANPTRQRGQAAARALTLRVRANLDRAFLRTRRFDDEFILHRAHAGFESGQRPRQPTLVLAGHIAAQHDAAVGVHVDRDAGELRGL
jgi:hypothetical protein